MSNYKGVVISLYDYTTIAVEPWANDGYICYCVDTQHTKGFNTYKKGIVTVGMDVREFLDVWVSSYDHIQVDFLCCFPPCTDLAVTGAKHFKSKLLNNPNYRQEAMELVLIGDYFGTYLECPFYIENPVSVISTEWRKPDYIINPYEYGGYLPLDDRHPKYPAYILPRDAYPKRTCLWTNSLFTLPERKEVPIRKGYSNQHNLLGGKSIRTKNIRSATPRGFALALHLQHRKRGDYMD